MTGRALILAVSFGPHRGRKAALHAGDTLCVGRSDLAGFSLPHDGQLSAKHFELTWDGRAARLRDLESIGGTRLNGEQKTEGDVPHGAWIRAGATDFTVHVEAHTPPAPDDDDEPPPAPAAAAPGEEEPPFPAEPPDPEPDDGALFSDDAEVRWNARQAAKAAHAERARQKAAAAAALPILTAAAREAPLHAVLDAARTPRILEILRESVEEHRSLYEGVQGEALDDVAPYLVRLSPGSRLLEQLVREGWGRRWGIYLLGELRQRDLRRHLRRFLMVEDDATRDRLYFRYYDPGVLRDLWPTCSRRQRDELVGPLRGYLVEGPRGEVLKLGADRVLEPLAAPSLPSSHG